ncbi:methyltransferase domain-containing protein [Roseobacter denitrificans]|uniref:Methyltransferase domain-containing protein n=1 Tax=Roseobacter denitrificans (strain ATCC 33942 / OCh 114) TaxID=375451 RepID=Q166D4_ROSDO|nr:methyltransferase domain-containing protein [Roseobacter denitrificans]ABG32159.1 conserved hypothetical protein [Roseobacter denitrificans OCh 114]AVL51664.1 methyltransferase domain-containing protein [Roseobacter denitrificans]SFF78112.1 Methyltransferase domain-containing protein [Roseobacter denitrificans OCh 114]
MTDGFLTKAYAARDAGDTRALYDDWSATYEAEVVQNGYATPGRCAEALAQFSSDMTAPILDFGCGTGLSGLALKLAGFRVIDGVDISSDMLEKAREKNLYRTLSVIEAGAALPRRPASYTAICAIGVIGAGAAPISVFHTLMMQLESGGLCVLSLNDHALSDPKNEAALSEWLDCGAARLLFKEHGPHLPGIDLKATVYVIEKT